MANYILYDPRIFGENSITDPVASRPNYFRSPPNGTIPQILDVIRRIPASTASENSILSIICHGIEMNGVGGYGLQLGAGSLSVFNLERFAVPLRNRFFAVAIYGCQAANVASGYDAQTRFGDGKFFCSQLSRLLNCRVVAGIHTQYVQVSDTGIFNLDDWRGDVVTFEPNRSPRIDRYELYQLNRQF